MSAPLRSLTGPSRFACATAVAALVFAAPAVLQAQDDPNRVFFVESWRDAEALAVHAKVPRMAENRAIYEPWLNSRRATRCNVP